MKGRVGFWMSLMACGCGRQILLAAEVEGQLVRAGEPVAGVQVDRRIHLGWSGDVWNQHARSDDDGWFRFEPSTSTLWLGAILPHEPGIRQTFTTQGVEFFSGSKSTYDATGLLGQPLKMRCHLDRPQGPETGLYWSSCERLVP